MKFYWLIALGLTTQAFADEPAPTPPSEETPSIEDVAPYEPKPTGPGDVGVENQPIPDEKELPFGQCGPSFVSVDQIVRRWGFEMKKQAQLRVTLTGDLCAETLDTLDITMEGYRPLDKDQARRLVVYATQRLVSAFNECKTPHPQLVRWPMTVNDLNLTIKFDTFFGSYLDYTMINTVTMSNGVITYCDYGSMAARKHREPMWEPFIAAAETVAMEHEWSRTCKSDGSARYLRGEREPRACFGGDDNESGNWLNTLLNPPAPPTPPPPK